MMNKEFVPYDIALALKELGFDVECFGCYTKDKELSLDYSTNKGEPHYFQDCAAPTYSQAFRWFRDKYDELHTWRLQTILSVEDYETYEEAELACLRKLIEIVNQNKDANI